MVHRNGKTIAKSLIAVAVVVMFIMGTASVFAAVDDHKKKEKGCFREDGEGQTEKA